MTYHPVAQIFMVCTQVGAWGYFDELSRVSIEILLDVAMRCKTILDAIRACAPSLLIMEEASSGAWRAPTSP